MDGDQRRILISDPIADEGIARLREAGKVDIRTGLSRDELLDIIGDYDALVVRSETKVTREVIEAGRKLVAIGRAGVGVDNIDLTAATERGIIVVNAPQGNTIAAAEHTIALLMALARHLPQADASLHGGEWRRKEFIGTEIRGKVLGIVGLGKIGSAVASRARGLEMRVIAADPFVPEERARALGVELVSVDDVIEQSDFITVHPPLTPDTQGMIGRDEIARMKDGVRIINVARGGIVDEHALLEGVREGKVAGAAIDVFSSEPPDPNNPLVQDPRIIVTPHLGASTTEAQERVALDVAEQIVEIFAGKPARYAVNAPLLDAKTLQVVGPYMEAAEVVGSIAMQLVTGQLQSIEISYFGEIADHDVTPLKAAVIKGLLKPISVENVNLVNASLIAQSRGWQIREQKQSEHDVFHSLIHVRVTSTEGQATAGGTVERGTTHIVLINDLDLDVVTEPGTTLLLCENQDRPGMIGRVGMELGQYDINISAMQVGRKQRRGNALMVLQLDEAPTEPQVENLNAIEGIIGCRIIRL